MSEAPEPKKLGRTPQLPANSFEDVTELFWLNLLEQCPDCLPEDEELRKSVKEICFSAIVTGVDWSLTQSPQRLARMFQELRAEDVE